MRERWPTPRAPPRTGGSIGSGQEPRLQRLVEGDAPGIRGARVDRAELTHELETGQAGVQGKRDGNFDLDEDLLVSLRGENAALLRNDGGNASPSVRVRLRQPTGNRFALGAEVTATIGGERLLGVIGAQGYYLSQHAVGELGFGLGDEAVVE